MVRPLALPEQATGAFEKGGWQVLFRLSDGKRVSSTTLLHPSERLQVTLQIPFEEDGSDWMLWLEACGEIPASLSGALAQPMTLRTMLDVARWLQGPIEEIEAMALATGRQRGQQLIQGEPPPVKRSLLPERVLVSTWTFRGQVDPYCFRTAASKKRSDKTGALGWAPFLLPSRGRGRLRLRICDGYGLRWLG